MHLLLRQLEDTRLRQPEVRQTYAGFVRAEVFVPVVTALVGIMLIPEPIQAMTHESGTIVLLATALRDVSTVTALESNNHTNPYLL